MTPLTWTLLMQLPTALIWYPLAWRVLLGRERGPSYTYFMAFAYLLAFALQHAAQVLGGATFGNVAAAAVCLTAVPAAAAAMAVQLAYARRHTPRDLRVHR